MRESTVDGAAFRLLEHLLNFLAQFALRQDSHLSTLLIVVADALVNGFAVVIVVDVRIVLRRDDERGGDVYFAGAFHALVQLIAMLIVLVGAAR